jgi:hypothetical protein
LEELINLHPTPPIAAGISRTGTSILTLSARLGHGPVASGDERADVTFDDLLASGSVSQAGPPNAKFTTRRVA